METSTPFRDTFTAATPRRRAKHHMRQQPDDQGPTAICIIFLEGGSLVLGTRISLTKLTLADRCSWKKGSLSGPRRTTPSGNMSITQLHSCRLFNHFCHADMWTHNSLCSRNLRDADYQTSFIAPSHKNAPVLSMASSAHKELHFALLFITPSITLVFGSPLST